METFFRFFAERSLLAYLITFTIILLGVSSLVTIKRDSFPEVAFGQLLITTQYPGASPEDVELKVTNEIEKELKEVIGIKRFTSTSMENISIIGVVIDPDEKDEDKVVQEIREAVSRVTDLPEEVTETPLVTELNTSVFPMIEIGLAGDLPYGELREIARRFEKKLENVPGVSKVERFGYRAREIKVEVNPNALKKQEATLVDIVNAIQRRNIRATGGSFESYTSEKNIVTLAQFRDPKEVGDVIVRSTFDGARIKVKDLAVILDDFEEEKVISRVDGQVAISFVAYKASSADIIRTVDAIKKMMDKQKQYLPETVNLLISDDQSTYVRNRFSIVSTNGLLGLTLVMLMLSLFLNIRIAFWVAMGVPVSMLGVIFLLPLFDTFLDSITLTAMVLVIGIIVDDAIIISEHIYERFEQGASPVDAAVQGVTGVFKPVLTTILTTSVVFLPLFFMPGMLGKFVYVIPLVITLALFVSLIESSMALPAHLAAGLRRSGKKVDTTAKQSGFHWLRNRYKKILANLLAYRYLLILLFFIVLATSLLYAYKFMDFVLFPSSTADRFIVEIETPTGTSLQATAVRASKIEAIVAQLDKQELDSFVTRVGTYGQIGSSERENNAAVTVSLTPFATRERSADMIIEELRTKANNIEGIEHIRFQIDAGGPPVGRPIELRVVGVNDNDRKQLADEIEEFLQSMKGTKDIDRDDKLGKHQIEIKLDYDKLARVGVSVADVARNVRVAYDGEVVTNVRYGDEDVDFRVIFRKSIRHDPKYLKKLLLPNRAGRQTQLGDLAKLKAGPGPSNFHHYKSDRAITITGDLDKDITTPIKVVAAVKEKFNIDRDYPGLQLIVGGEAEESAKSIIELLIILGIACLGVYFLLILLFNSLWQPILVMIAIPFGIIGVIVAFAIHDATLGFLAMTGIIGLAGVVVNDSLVLVNHINELRSERHAKNIRLIVATGTANRLRAIILTTASTVAGLLPLAYGLGGSDPYMSPMALALGWGLLFATPLTLVLVPCLYLVGEDVRHAIQRIKFRKEIN